MNQLRSETEIERRSQHRVAVQVEGIGSHTPPYPEAKSAESENLVALGREMCTNSQFYNETHECLQQGLYSNAG